MYIYVIYISIYVMYIYCTLNYVLCSKIENIIHVFICIFLLSPKSTEKLRMMVWAKNA